MTQQWIHDLQKEDSEWISIMEECKDEAVKIFVDIINQEKAWAKYLFCYGNILGLNEEICCNYIDYLATQRARKIGLELPKVFLGRNPLPWTADWIGGNNRQVAMQESENDSYIIGLFDGGILDGVDHLKDIFSGKSDDVAQKGDISGLSKYFM